MQPAWLDRYAYPFTSRWLDVDGGRMHYVDEGSGAPVLFVHGTPVWSFLYRNQIRALAPEYRCIAADHIGFGLSDKPAGWSYQFADHAANLDRLINALDLRSITLVVHDLGGPIGLAYALAHPERISRLIIMNTCMWPMEGAFAIPAVGKLFGGPLGRFLYLRMNISARTLLPMVYAERSRLTPAIHQQYLAPFPRPTDRQGMFAFAQQVAAGLPWCAELWAQRERLPRCPTAIIWGEKDPAFGLHYLQRWRELCPDAPVHSLADCGHFVAEERPDALLGAIRALLPTHVSV